MRKFLSNKVFEYEEVIEILTEHLNGIPNIQEFCAQHNLGYNTVLMIKNNYKKPFPKVVTKLLNIFGYKVQEVTAYKFLDQETENEKTPG